ncbi:uncharacterized protein RSE6_00424 [Rhynchosporium secalis]|uniref:Uncharacterized protein n=1 Tax=Rhynchosporium secalis TaxID=38038 RepID=A0A1E1LV90_RHYSE|nr:uncharacterized protein RSE6_00424 [Rhynchosporium secalis]
MVGTKTVLHIVEILGVFFCAHHLWPKGVTPVEQKVVLVTTTPSTEDEARDLISGRPSIRNDRGNTMKSTKNDHGPGITASTRNGRGITTKNMRRGLDKQGRRARGIEALKGIGSRYYE